MRKCFERNIVRYVFSIAQFSLNSASEGLDTIHFTMSDEATAGTFHALLPLITIYSKTEEGLGEVLVKVAYANSHGFKLSQRTIFKLKTR